MMRSMKFLVLSSALVFAACSKKEEGAGGGGGGGGAPKAQKLPKYGLVIDVPGEVMVNDNVVGEGHMINGSTVGAMAIEEKQEAPALDAAKSDADMYSPKNLNAETLPDGYALTFENKGGMGTNYWVDVTRTIDGKHYKCWSTGADKSQAANVLAAC